MTSANEPNDEASKEPGRARTPWHPLLVELLRWLLQGGYDVRDEVPVGTLPLKIDVLLLQKESGNVSQWAGQYLPELLPRLRRRTLIEFKGPTDLLQKGDWELLKAYALHYLQQQLEPIGNCDVSLIFMAPTVTKAFRDSLVVRQLSLEAEPGEAGIHRIAGGMFDTWVIETDEMARRQRPVSALVSRLFLRQPADIIQGLVARGFGQVLPYMLQQIQQFRQHGAEWAMQYPELRPLFEIDPALREAVIGILTPEERLQGLAPEERLQGLAPEERLQGLAPEERLQGLAPEERLQGLAPEERLRGLTPEELLRLRDYLEKCNLDKKSDS